MNFPRNLNCNSYFKCYKSKVRPFITNQHRIAGCLIKSDQIKRAFSLVKHFYLTVSALRVQLALNKKQSGNGSGQQKIHKPRYIIGKRFHFEHSRRKWEKKQTLASKARLLGMQYEQVTGLIKLVNLTIPQYFSVFNYRVLQKSPRMSTEIAIA